MGKESTQVWGSRSGLSAGKKKSTKEICFKILIIEIKIFSDKSRYDEIFSSLEQHNGKITGSKNFST